MKFKKIPKKQNFFHRNNPFNAALKNRLKNTLGQSDITPRTFTSPVLDQGQTEDCAVYASVATRAAITGKTYSISDYLSDILEYLGQTGAEYEGCDLATAMQVGVSPGFMATDGTTDHYDAILWITQEGDSFWETINSYIQKYKRPANLAGVWFQEMFNTVNGVVPPGGTTLLGGHDMMLDGETSDAYADNQGSWGVDAEGSIAGHYKFSPQVFDSYYTGYKCGIGINSDDPLVKLLGKLNALYTQLIDKL